MLTGTVVRLRPVREEDLDWLVVESGKPASYGEFEPFVLGTAEGFRLRFDADGLLSDSRTLLVVEDRNARKLGVAAIENLDVLARVASISATILDLHERGKGLGTDAHRVLVTYLFRHRGLARVESFVGAGNLAARSLLKRLGFQEEGVLRGRVWAHGTRHDVVVCGLLAEEWLDRMGPQTVSI